MNNSKEFRGGMVVGALAFIGLSFMAVGSQVTTPNTFTAGDVAVAEDVNANFAAHAVGINDNDVRVTGNSSQISNIASKVSDNVPRFTPFTRNASATISNPANFQWNMLAVVGTFEKVKGDSTIRLDFQGRLTTEGAVGGHVTHFLRLSGMGNILGEPGVHTYRHVSPQDHDIDSFVFYGFSPLPAGIYDVELWVNATDTSSLTINRVSGLVTEQPGVFLEQPFQYNGGGDDGHEYDQRHSGQIEPQYRR